MLDGAGDDAVRYAGEDTGGQELGASEKNAVGTPNAALKVALREEPFRPLHGTELNGDTDTDAEQRSQGSL